MRRRIKRSSLFTMVAVVALLSLGIGYAAWEDTLTINGYVDTGSLDMQWQGDSEIDGDGAVANGGTCEASINSGGKNLLIDITNAYPGYECTVLFNLHNNGTVPAVLANPVALPATEDGVEVLGLCIDAGETVAPGTNYTYTGANAALLQGYSCGIVFEFNDDLAQGQNDMTRSVTFDFVNSAP